MSARRVPGIGAGIAAVLLPPLGIWLVAGLGRDFWIGVLLTCLFFVPGVLWALFILFRRVAAQEEVAARRPVPS